ncbi:MAG: hypothetical protein AB1486_35635 [Planctomycetota bacterium]
MRVRSACVGASGRDGLRGLVASLIRALARLAWLTWPAGLEAEELRLLHAGVESSTRDAQAIRDLDLGTVALAEGQQSPIDDPLLHVCPAFPRLEAHRNLDDLGAALDELAQACAWTEGRYGDLRGSRARC